MRAPQMAPDWGRIIEDILRAGLSGRREICRVIGVELTDRMISHYSAGTQPTYWRGVALLDLWSRLTKHEQAAAPMREVVRGHRVPNNRNPNGAPQMRAPLPQWPPIHQIAKEAKAKRKPAPARPKKVKEPA